MSCATAASGLSNDRRSRSARRHLGEILGLDELADRVTHPGRGFVIGENMLAGRGIFRRSLVDASLPSLTYVGGPTALLQWRGLRMLTDPTFDPAGTAYESPAYTLHKLQGPAIEAGELGRLDVVLLSHEHHFDNLDRSGRPLLPSAGCVLTTTQGAATLGHGATGLAPWETSEICAPGGATMRVTAAPARHGRAHADRGPVIGFVLAFDQDPDQTVYFSGDTVWYDGVREVAARFRVTTALLCLGAARVSAVGDWPLTFTAQEAVEAARAMPSALIVPLHFEGWEHFSESREDVDGAFKAAGLSDRLRWPEAGKAIDVGAD